MKLGASLDNYFEGAMTGVHTSLPADVVEYNVEKHLAKVAPSIEMLMSNGVQIKLPELIDVPVIFPAAKSFDLDFPLEKGDKVLLVFVEQDISNWKAGKENATPETASRFGLDNAVAIPGLFPSPQQGKVHLSIEDGGKLALSSEGELNIQSKGKVVINGHLEVARA